MFFRVSILVEQDAVKNNACYKAHLLSPGSARELTAVMACMRDEYVQQEQYAGVYLMEVQIRFCDLAMQMYQNAVQILKILAALAAKTALHVISLPFQVLAGIFTSEEFVTILVLIRNSATECTHFFFGAVGNFLHLQTKLKYEEQEMEVWKTALRLWTELDTLVSQAAALAVKRF